MMVKEEEMKKIIQQGDKDSEGGAEDGKYGGELGVGITFKPFSFCKIHFQYFSVDKSRVILHRI